MSTESRISRMEAMMAAIAGKLGIDDDEVETPKTTARLGTGAKVSRMATKSAPAKQAAVRGDANEVVFENVGGTRADGRMRLPAKMFGTRDTISVDGHKFTKLVSDQNRSANFSPSLLGAEIGDTITMTRVKGSQWTAEIESSGRKTRAKAKTAPAASKAKSTPAAAPKGVKVGTSKMALVKEAAKKFGLAARENAATGFQNENILEATKFEDDPRQYLTSRENAQAKRVWKGKAGITLSQWVEALSEEVFG